MINDTNAKEQGDFSGLLRQIAMGSSLKALFG